MSCAPFLGCKSLPDQAWKNMSLWFKLIVFAIQGRCKMHLFGAKLCGIKTNAFFDWLCKSMFCTVVRNYQLALDNHIFIPQSIQSYPKQIGHLTARPIPNIWQPLILVILRKLNDTKLSIFFGTLTPLVCHLSSYQCLEKGHYGRWCKLHFWNTDIVCISFDTIISKTGYSGLMLWGYFIKSQFISRTFCFS